MSPTRPLEVSTDAPQPPSVSIISPTPRAFTFPVSHNLSDSPYSSPSHSPFQPDLATLSISSVSPSQHEPASPYKRRKSSSLDVERRPKKGDEDYIKRPKNAFILFRQKCCEDRAAEEADGTAKKQRQADLSKTISQQWRGLSSEERKYWEQLAKEKKKEHELLYPDYVYRPQRVRDKDGKTKKNKKRRGEHDTDSDSVTFILPETNIRPHGRSISAPNRPSPYQAIQIPLVYGSPSCPTSPSTPNSLLPMISRRSGHPGHSEDDFDFNPNDSLMPSFGQASFDSNLQSSELLRSMFNMESPTSALEPLDLSHSMLLPLSSASSIGSGSSGPSSPQSGPFTPTSSTHQFDSHPPAIQGEGDWDLPHMGMEMIHYAEQSQQEYCEQPNYSWGTNGAPMWTDQEPTVMFAGDDFDVNAIPPIQLGMAKYAVEQLPVDYSQQHQQLEDQIMGFDDMIAGRSF